jgi:NADPH-dependent 2,4-dienoyl-CoA reductase/sulfur reductase-like enzyme
MKLNVYGEDMPDRTVDVLLIGGGVTSATCAQSLLEEGFDGSVLLVAREGDPPYDRPPLTKEYLRGEQERGASAVPEAGWFERDTAELMTRTTVTSLDAAGREATLSTKETVGFGRALIATGSNVRRLQVEGAELDGLHYVRTYGTIDSIRADLDGAEQAACVGGSFIGCEVAASLTALGKPVTIVMLEQDPFDRIFGASAGAFFRRVLEEHGVTVIGGDQIERFEGSGRVERLVTESGREIAAQLVVCGVGVTPDVKLAKDAGLELGDSGGIRCDSHLAASAEGIWAAGDVCEYESVVHGGSRLRVEHADHAWNQGHYAGKAMLGTDEPYDVIPYFFSDLADWASFEYVGPARDWDEEVVSGETDGGEFGVWYLKQGRVLGALSVGGAIDLDRARELMRSGASVQADVLR